MNWMKFIALAMSLGACTGCGGSNSAEAPKESTLVEAPEIRALLTLNTAKELEASGRRQEALQTYEILKRDYPNSPEAAQAATRIQALGGK
jgi:hypothetical protein